MLHSPATRSPPASPPLASLAWLAALLASARSPGAAGTQRTPETGISAQVDDAGEAGTPAAGRQSNTGVSKLVEESREWSVRNSGEPARKMVGIDSACTCTCTSTLARERMTAGGGRCCDGEAGDVVAVLPPHKQPRHVHRPPWRSSNNTTYRAPQRAQRHYRE